jgi:hypothetical protein
MIAWLIVAALVALFNVTASASDRVAEGYLTGQSIQAHTTHTLTDCIPGPPGSWVIEVCRNH